MRIMFIIYGVGEVCSAVTAVVSPVITYETSVYALNITTSPIEAQISVSFPLLTFAAYPSEMSQVIPPMTNIRRAREPESPSSARIT